MEADKETGTRNVSFIKAKCKIKKWKATNKWKINEFSIKSIFLNFRNWLKIITAKWRWL